ncbi:hypothetical protein SeMB42_g03183 [Synchytrium endobioticum]|uniref:Uncharacterized protein n=1 Tax=Synchytrium endobioticum TaxID=286115 RepID=A0A507DAB4_9FUNG|nr:hypothetical protein SeMB42_g03183 [Synchytrium endobioticum]
MMNWTGNNGRAQSNAKLELERQKTFFSKQRLKLKFGSTKSQSPRLINRPVILDPITTDSATTPCNTESHGGARQSQKKKQYLKSAHHQEGDGGERPVKRHKSVEKVPASLSSDYVHDADREEQGEENIVETILPAQYQNEEDANYEDEESNGAEEHTVSESAKTQSKTAARNFVLGSESPSPTNAELVERLDAMESMMKQLKLENIYLKRDLRGLTDRLRVLEDCVE